jgi:hypothetical protein
MRDIQTNSMAPRGYEMENANRAQAASLRPASSDRQDSRREPGQARVEQLLKAHPSLVHEIE